MADAVKPRFFSTTKKGENYELKADLNSEYRDKRKETVKKVIANMTLGKDVSSLFPDVVKNMQTEDLELKKLVYLYLINYAKTQPELVILAVNTFVKVLFLKIAELQDSDDPNPLIRALAIRTMGCLRADKIVDYLCDPLKKALRVYIKVIDLYQDEDPYVRKTGALCVSKLFDLNPTIAIENGLLHTLQDLLSDRNPMVIANAVAALTEITEASVQKDIFIMNEILLAKLLAALNECTEWGQTCILTCLATYRPKSAREATEIIERVIPRLQHVNASVVLAAVKVLMVYLDYNVAEELNQTIIRKLAPPLVTLLSTEPEIQYVALRNINLILQKRPEILSQETRVFFTKYNDPPYVKLEKLEVIVKLANQDNIDQVLSELREYANEVDVDFVRKSLKAIGRCAIKIESASDRCVQVLMDLLSMGVNYIVQETIVVMKDIFRKYPSKYEGVIPTLCQSLEVLDESDSKAALIWIVGEYAQQIENAGELLEHFLENFKYENSKVQLQLITATVKLFLKRPSSAQQLVQQVLQNATQSNDNPDIRDRAFIYWRLLSASPEAAKKVVLAEKPPIESDQVTVSNVLLDELLRNIGTLASVVHKSPALFGSSAQVDTSAYRDGANDGEELQLPDRNTILETAQAMGTSKNLVENLLDLDFDAPIVTNTNTSPVQTQPSNLMDLLSMDLEPMSVSAPISKETFLSAESAQGFELVGNFTSKNGQVCMELTFTNKSAAPMSDFAIQFNVNSYGLLPGVLSVPTLSPSQSANVTLVLSRTGNPQPMTPVNMLQIAVKNNVGVYYFTTHVPENFV
ncbi:hypothetical protein HDV02_002958 [Globomyces sp. JEL0801]|nr:hypothetical protein HDV02_002958 [Globomyces sp. JEL0801]